MLTAGGDGTDLNALTVSVAAAALGVATLSAESGAILNRVSRPDFAPVAGARGAGSRVHPAGPAVRLVEDDGLSLLILLARLGFLPLSVSCGRSSLAVFRLH